MLKKEYNEEVKNIRSLISQNQFDDAHYLFRALTEFLFKEKKYEWIVDLYKPRNYEDWSEIITFELAYCLHDKKSYDESERIYRELLSRNPNNTSILNNLHNILYQKHKIDEAWQLIQKAYELDPHDEIVSRNYESLAEEIQLKNEKEAIFNDALSKLKLENDFVLSKLTKFITSVKADTSYKNGVIPIPKWKFKILMGTDEQKATSLTKQWLEKGYIYKTGDRGSYNELVYELNPHLLGAIQKNTSKTINENWLNALISLDTELLESLGYYEVKDKVSKTKRSIRRSLERDLDELFINYILKNSKSVIVLSGSIVELLLIYNLEKKSISMVEYSIGSKNVRRKLYDCSLNDLLSYCEERKILENVTVHLGNVSRLLRNFIHPGKELKEKADLDFGKANLCFATTMEVLKAVL